MNSRFSKISATLAVMVVASFLTATASAQCGNLAIGKTEGSLHRQSWRGQSGFAPGRYLPAHDSDENDPIVGFWRVKFVIPATPDDIVIDDGLVQWHADGTEIMNSNRPPVTGSFCLGVWKKIGTSKYKLNHFAKSWDENSNPVGSANIQEIVVLSRNGKTFEGAFTIDQYDPAGNVTQHAEGKVVGTRIGVNTTIHGLL
jgi:hypothetical protein